MQARLALALLLVPLAADAKPRSLQLDTDPMRIRIAGDRMFWLDTAGELWTTSAGLGGKPSHLTDQHDAGGFLLDVVSAHGAWIGAGDHGLVDVDVATGKTTQMGVKLPDDPIELVTDGDAVFVALFKQPQVIRVAADGASSTLFELARPTIAIAGSTVFAASYTTGELVSHPTSGGKTTTIAKKLPHPTALAADATYAYVACETDNTLRRFELATGKELVLAKDLSNSDHVIVDGNWVYYDIWAGGHHDKLVRVSTDGKTSETLADDLAAPTAISVDANAIYVASRDDHRIVRIAKPR